MARHDAAGGGAQHRVPEASSRDLDEHAWQGARVRDVARPQQRDDGKCRLSGSRLERLALDAEPPAGGGHSGAAVKPISAGGMATLPRLATITPCKRGLPR